MKLSDLFEATSSAGLTKKEKSTLVKKAKSGGDVGKKGKGFDKVVNAVKKSGKSEEDATKIAAAAMWKNRAKKG